MSHRSTKRFEGIQRPGGRDDETIGSLLTRFAFHEAYHVGETGLLRRLAGFEGAIA